MRILLLLTVIASLTGCATWEGFKSDVKSGADAVDDAFN